MTYGSVTINDRLEVEFYSIRNGKKVHLQLTRINAQIISEILRQHSGVPNASAKTYGSREIIPAVDLTPDSSPKPKKTDPVKVHKGAMWLPGGDRSQGRKR